MAFHDLPDFYPEDSRSVYVATKVEPATWFCYTPAPLVPASNICPTMNRCSTISDAYGVIFELEDVLVEFPVDRQSVEQEVLEWLSRSSKLTSCFDDLRCRLGSRDLGPYYEIVRRYEAQAVALATPNMSGIKLAWDAVMGGKTVGLISSSTTETVREILVLLDLQDYFDVIVGGDVAEPDRGIRMILQNWRLRRDEVEVVRSTDQALFAGETAPVSLTKSYKQIAA